MVVHTWHWSKNWPFFFFFFFFFDLFGIDGLKNFIIQDHESVIQKILFGIEKMARTDKFSMNVCQTLNKKEIDNWSETARDFFYFLESFGNKVKVRDLVNLWMVEDPIQSLDTVTCGIFWIYFYDKQFKSDVNSKM